MNKAQEAATSDIYCKGNTIESAILIHITV